MTTISEMGDMAKHSKEWNAAAMESVEVSDHIRTVALKIASVYRIGGQSDPGWIANMIQHYIATEPTVCPVTTTGEHSEIGPDNYCIWCHRVKSDKPDVRATTASSIPSELNWCSVCQKNIEGDTWLSDDTHDGRHFCYDCAPEDAIRLKDTLQPRLGLNR